MSVVNDDVVREIDAPVTHKVKCYIFVCCGCDLLNVSSRNDALTCSTACRVRAHRNGYIKMLRKLAIDYELVDDNNRALPALIKQAEAIKRLRPDLSADIDAGTLTIKQAQSEMYRSFMELVWQQVEAEA